MQVQHIMQHLAQLTKLQQVTELGHQLQQQ